MTTKKAPTRIPITKDNMKLSVIPPGYVGIGVDGVGIVEIVKIEELQKSTLSAEKSPSAVTVGKKGFVTCEKCGAEIPEEDLQNHLENECPLVIYEKMQTNPAEAEEIITTTLPRKRGRPSKKIEVNEE